MNWRLSKIQYPIYNLGPGKRIGIWVQGCNLACEGCINQMLWSKRKGKYLPVYEVFNIIKNLEEDYDGITISGGEPFQQYEQLIAFIYLIKTQTKLNIQCYTGYELNELSTLYQDGLYLKFIDYLVDGRYVQSQHENENIKGIRICRQANAKWVEEFDERIDPHKRKYYWLTGKFVNNDHGEDTDEWALANGFVSVVPTQYDLTAHHAIATLNTWDF